MTLLIEPCSYAAARRAVMNWHYSRSMPPPRRVMLGVWEDGRFAGAVIFSRGASSNIGKPYGVAMNEVAELTRVALRAHSAPVSQIVAECLRQVKASAPGLRLVVSFADPMHGHKGGIYQAGNWIYLGTTAGDRQFIVHGVQRHSRSMAGKQFGNGRRTRQSLGYLREHVDPNAQAVLMPGKHRYAMPFDKQMRRRLLKLAEPYPVVAGEASARRAPEPSGERRVQLPPPARSERDR